MCHNRRVQYCEKFIDLESEMSGFESGVFDLEQHLQNGDNNNFE